MMRFMFILSCLAMIAACADIQARMPKYQPAIPHYFAGPTTEERDGI